MNKENEKIITSSNVELASELIDNPIKLNRAQRRAKAKFQKKLIRNMEAALKRWSTRKKNKDIIPQGATLTETMNKMTDEEKISFYSKMYKAVVDKRIELEKEAAANGDNED